MKLSRFALGAALIFLAAIPLAILSHRSYAQPTDQPNTGKDIMQDKKDIVQDTKDIKDKKADKRNLKKNKKGKKKNKHRNKNNDNRQPGKL